MSIFTKIGDYGQTKMFTGDNIKKSSVVIESLSHSDELCGTISRYLSLGKDLNPNYEFIQNNILHNLFIFNAFISNYDSDSCITYKIPENTTKILETEIKTIVSTLPKQTKFIQHCSDVLYLSANDCRTKVRLLEVYVNRVLDSSRNAIFMSNITQWLIWLNRLSNYFYNVSLLHVFNTKYCHNDFAELVYFTM